MGIFTDSVVIVFMSPIVIGKRVVKFARGCRPAKKEAKLAVNEKARLGASSAASLASGNSLGSVVKRYRQKVVANARRL